MAIQLSKPLVFIDLETTGINVAQDRIVEIAIIKAHPTEEIKKMRKLVNPGMPIPAQASAVHGITNEMVANAPTFKEVANEIKQFIAGCDVGGYNSNRFDIPLLVEEFLRIGLEVDFDNVEMLDVQKIFHLMEPRNLSAAYKFYCDKDLENAHSAEADIAATWEILQAQVIRYADKNIGTTVAQILDKIGREKLVDYARRFVYDEKDRIVFNFGKHKGKPVEQVLNEEPQYYDWMQRADFEEHTKLKLRQIFNKMKFGK
jgi:DNA polymerase-3 subunit epsilon